MEKKFLTELLRSTVISPRVLEEWRDKAAQRKGQCDGMLGTLRRGGSMFPWKQLDLQAWEHMAVLSGACYWFGGGKNYIFMTVTD